MPRTLAIHGRSLMTIRLRASVQSLVFVVMQAATLFGSAGRIDIVEFWVYVAILAAVSALSLTLLDPDLIQERMRPGGRRVGLRFLPVIIVMFVHWTVAGLDRSSSSCSCTGRWPASTADACILATRSRPVWKPWLWPCSLWHGLSSSGPCM